MVIPVRQTIQRDGQLRRAGFTLIEVLVAVGVMGVATTILVSSYTSSLKLAQSSKTHNVAMQLAEEYMNELRIHPDLFIWPDFSTEASKEGLQQIALRDEKNPIFLVSPSNAIAPNKEAFIRDKNLYGKYGWYAYARLNEATDNYVEVMVQIHWLDNGREQNLCLSSSVPRSVGEGIGK